MPLVQSLRNKPIISEADLRILEGELRQSNFQRAVYILVGAVVVNIFLILQFRYNAGHGTAQEIMWRESIIQLNTILLCINILFGAAALYIYKSKNDYSKLKNLIMVLVFLEIPLWGAITVSLDQWVTTSITPFFLVGMVCSLGLIIKPSISFLQFLFTYLVFYFGISYTQSNTDILLSNRVDGFGAMVICSALSLLLWRNNILRFLQSKKITDQQHQLEKSYNNLLKISEDLSASNSTKDKFFSIIAHDLRGPITSTLTLTELMLEGRNTDSGNEDDLMLKMLNDSLNNTSKLLSNLLLWARTQTNNVLIQPVEIALSNNISENISLLFSQAKEKSIIIYNEVPDNLHIVADAEMLNTILRNLISNAIKFTNNGGEIHISTKNATSNREKKFITICVQDNGIGMAPDKMKNLFQIDKKITSYGTNNESGTGLGLILCKEFIEKHGGKIWVESNPENGSCFYFTIPAAE